MQALLALTNQYDLFLVTMVLTIPRVYAFMTSSQLLNSTFMPGITRIGAMLTIVLLIVPMNLGFAKTFPHEAAPLAIHFIKEYALGAVLGYFVAWTFWVVQSAGAFIDNQRGASIASSIDPLFGTESTPMGDMFSLVFITFIFASGGALQVLDLLFRSFAIWPIGQDWRQIGPDFPRLILGVFDFAMRMAFDIAAPVIIVMFLAEFSLAMVSRFAPQVQVFVLAMPIKSILAIFMLVFYSSVLFPYMNRQVGRATGFSERFYQIVMPVGAPAQPKRPQDVTP